MNPGSATVNKYQFTVAFCLAYIYLPPTSFALNDRLEYLINIVNQMMKKPFLIIFFFLIIFQSAQGFDFEKWEIESTESFSKLHKRWMNHHSVERKLGEKVDRFSVFQDNVVYVYHNTAIPYNLKLNKFADWTFEEFSNFYGGCYAGYESEVLETRSGHIMYENASQPPGWVDWRKRGAVTPIKDQGKCGKSKKREMLPRIYAFCLKPRKPSFFGIFGRI